MEKEYFVPLNKFGGDIYEISNLGRIKRLTRVCLRGKKGDYIIEEKILKPTINNVGYFVINLKYKGIGSYCLLHRLISETFIPNPENKPLVNHIDGDKLNNSLCNLEWVNKRENYSHWALTQNHASKYTGVTWDKKLKNWSSHIRNGKLVRIGGFKTEEEAHQAYLNALIILKSENKYS